MDIGRRGTCRLPPGPSSSGPRAKPGLFGGLPRYATVGASGVVINLMVVWVLHTSLGWRFVVASAIATQTAILTNYLGNELWTFHRGRLAWGRLARFELASLTGMVLTVSVAALLVDDVSPVVAQFAGILVGSGVNYALNFFWTWRS